MRMMRRSSPVVLAVARSVALGTGLELGRGQVHGLVEARETLGLMPAAEDACSDDATSGALLVSLGLALRR